MCGAGSATGGSAGRTPGPDCLRGQRAKGRGSARTKGAACHTGAEAAGDEDEKGGRVGRPPRAPGSARAAGAGRPEPRALAPPRAQRCPAGSWGRAASARRPKGPMEALGPGSARRRPLPCASAVRSRSQPALQAGLIPHHSLQERSCAPRSCAGAGLRSRVMGGTKCTSRTGLQLPKGRTSAPRGASAHGSLRGVWKRGD